MLPSFPHTSPSALAYLKSLHAEIAISEPSLVPIVDTPFPPASRFAEISIGIFDVDCKTETVFISSSFGITRHIIAPIFKFCDKKFRYPSSAE